jgi:hypothetical protein
VGAGVVLLICAGAVIFRKKQGILGLAMTALLVSAGIFFLGMKGIAPGALGVVGSALLLAVDREPSPDL